MTVPVMFVDLDSTVRKGYDELGRFVNGPGDVEVFPEAAEMVRRWKASGGRVAAVSNQKGVALGHLSREDAVAAAVETNRQCWDLIDGIQMCMHGEDAGCWCRKPGVGMLVLARHHLERNFEEEYSRSRMLMVGDRPEDRGCAEAAGIEFLDAAEWRARA
jgi:D-glycero-D-manno-heptose 1,7-bisphosphate phosphatase